MTVTVDQIIDAKVHIGTLKNQSHPKTQKYRETIINGLVVVKPEVIKEQLEKAREKIQEAKKEWKEVLVVCEKSMYIKELEELSSLLGIHYLNHKIPAGFLTNFDTLQKRIGSMNEVESFMETDDFDRLTKKEQLTYARKLTRAQKIYKGVKKLTKKPDLVVAIDGARMDSFVKELEKTKVDTIVISSTDFGKYMPEGSLVMTNIWSYRSLDFVMRYILSK